MGNIATKSDRDHITSIPHAPNFTAKLQKSTPIPPISDSNTVTETPSTPKRNAKSTPISTLRHSNTAPSSLKGRSISQKLSRASSDLLPNHPGTPNSKKKNRVSSQILAPVFQAKNNSASSPTVSSTGARSAGEFSEPRFSFNSPDSGATNNARTSMTSDMSSWNPEVSNPKPRTLRDKEKLRESHSAQLVVKYYESVDGGYLAPFGNYSFEKLDYDTGIVKNLIVTRRLAPFYTPLEDYSKDWTRSQLIKRVNKVPLHEPIPETIEKYESVPLGDMNVSNFDYLIDRNMSKLEQQYCHYQIYKARLYQRKREWQKTENELYSSEKKILRMKKKGDLKYQDHFDKNLASDDLKYIIYKNIQECPICFMFLPGPLNYSKCCNQPICTECFIQIKRADPHFPHDEIDENGRDVNNIPENERDPESLISEPACCPYCAINSFEVGYIAPTNRRTGLGGIPPGLYKMPKDDDDEKKEMNDSTETTTTGDPSSSLLLNPAPHVQYYVSTDSIRPNWREKLADEKYKLARKAANATAIHFQNQLLNTCGSGENIGGYAYTGSMGQAVFSNVDELERKMVEEAIRQSLQSPTNGTTHSSSSSPVRAAATSNGTRMNEGRYSNSHARLRPIV